MFTISLKSIIKASLVSITWIFGIYALMEIFSDFWSQWYWYLLAFLYTVIINEYFGHLCCGHTIFTVDPQRIAYKVLVFLNCVDNGWGPPSSMAFNHANHHMYADQGTKDFSNPRNQTIWGWPLSPVWYLYNHVVEWPDKQNYFNNQLKIFQHIVKDPWTEFCEAYSHWLTIVYWALLWWLAPMILFKIVFVSRVIMSVLTLFAGIIGHSKIPGSYKNFHTNDLSHNNLWLHYLCLCLFPTCLHNNHHARAYNFSSGLRIKFFEFDLSVYPMRLLRYFLEKRIKE